MPESRSHVMFDYRQCLFLMGFVVAKPGAVFVLKTYSIGSQIGHAVLLRCRSRSFYLISAMPTRPIISVIGYSPQPRWSPGPIDSTADAPEGK